MNLEPKRDHNDGGPHGHPRSRVGEREGGELSFLASVRRPVVARIEERGARAKFPLPRRARASACQAAVRVENMPPLPGKRHVWP